MDDQNYTKTLREGGRTIRMNTNRREDLILQQELEDVNKKITINLHSLKELKKLEAPTEHDLFKRKLGPEFIPQPPKKERKTKAVFHDNLKTKDIKPDQYLMMPSIPAYSPVDEGPKTVLESRSRKYPYAHKKLTTTDEMKKPKISSLGVLPLRASSDIPNLRVMLEGIPAPAGGQENKEPPRLYNTPANSFMIPHLSFGGLDSDRESIQEVSVEERDIEETPLKKPAILPGVGTAATIKFCERAKPLPKKSYLRPTRKKSANSKIVTRPNTAESFQSSLLSAEIELPDDATYSKYDDAIDQIENDKDLETAVGFGDKDQRNGNSSNGSVKSMKELLEEAKKLSSPSSEPLYKQHNVENTKEGKPSLHKEDKKQSSLKPMPGKPPKQEVKADKLTDDKKDIPKAEEVAELKRGERTVDEIIASLRDQSAYYQETEADRKIQEIMNRVMSRTNVVIVNGQEDKEVEKQNLDVQSDDDVTQKNESPIPKTDLDQDLGTLIVSPELSTLEETIPWGEKEAFLLTESTTGNNINDETVNKTLTFQESEGQALTMRTLETAQTGTDEFEDSDLESHIEAFSDAVQVEEPVVVVDFEKAWEDLLAPPEATVEDILSIRGASKGMQERKLPAPDTGAKPNVLAPSVSFLSTWAPAAPNKFGPLPIPEKQYSNNIHHFCRVTMEYQLPLELMNVGRKYHTPDRFPSIKPDQPFRFNPGELVPPAETVPSTASSGTRLDRAADRVVQAMGETPSTLLEWQQKAESLLGETEITVSGQQVKIKTDESQVYWNPAPPKLGAAPQQVRERLFPLYQLEELDDFGQVKIAQQGVEESDSSEEEEHQTVSVETKAALERTIRKRHNSAEMLTDVSRDEGIANIEKFVDSEATTGVIDGLESSDVIQHESDHTRVTGSHFVRDNKSHVQRRLHTAPKTLYSNDDTLIVPQDYNTAMHEITEQKKLLEKAKRQIRLQDAFDELEKLEVNNIPVTDTFDILQVNHSTSSVNEEPTPAEKALQAGRNYVILPKKKKKKKSHRTLDLAKIEAAEKMLTAKSTRKLSRRESLPKLNRIIEREFRVSWQIRHGRCSIPDLLNFNDYKIRKRIPSGEEERGWVRRIWNTWFDEVFPPTPVDSEEEELEEKGDERSQTGDRTEDQKKGKKDSTVEVLTQDIEEIDPITDTPDNAEIYQILCDEIIKLSQVIDSMQNPTAFDYCRRGALYRKIGQLKKAETDLDRAIKMEPGLLDAYWHRHLLYILQDRKSAALDDLNFIMKKNKNHSGAYRSMAEIHKKQGDITMAIINYSSAIKYNPLDHEAFYQRALLYEQRGDMLLAMEDYTNTIKIMPYRTDAIMKHGMYYFENQNWGNAVNDFTELLRVDPLNATARLLRGRAYARMNNWVPALEDLSATIHLDPFNWQAFYQRACILRKAHPERALQDFSVSLTLNDTEENLMSYLHRGILYNTLGKPESAIPDFESVLKLNKDVAAAHVNLGLIFMTRHSNYHRAIKKFTSAINVDPTYVRAYVCRAEAYHKIHELKNALKDFTKAIHLRPDVHHYYMYRGQLVLELGNLDLAAFCVHHAAELGLDNPNSSLGVSPTQQAVVQSFLKNYDKAVEALQQATRVKPTAPTYMLLGKTHMKAKQFQEAVTSFTEALDKMKPWKKGDAWPPEAADAHFLSGICLMEMRNYSEALHQFNHAIKLRPSYADAYYQRGMASVRLRQVRGIQDFNRALAINPKIFQAFLSRACYYGQKGKYAKAILNCNEAIKLQPRSVRAFLYRGALKYYIKAYELAILDLSKAISLDTQCPLPYFNRAVCYHESSQHAKALTDYSIVLLLGDMLELKVLINRGLLYFEKKDYTNALYDFQAAAKLNPSDHRIHHTLGLCFHKLRHLREAVSTFTKCLKLKPFFLDGLIARGNVFMDYGHEQGIEMARRDYQRVLRLDPLCLPARINLAYTAQVSGKMMQAWKHFTAVIEVRQGYKPALEGRAIVNLQMSNTFGAFQDINTSINYGPTAELLTNRGVINQFMGDSVLAMQDYQKAIKLDQNFSLAYFNAGNVYFHTRHFKQALNYFTKAIECNDQDESAYLNSAITKVLLHDTKGALEDFNMAAKLSPYSAHIYFNRANLYMSQQQYELAEKEYTTALELKPDDALMLKRRADVRGKLGRRAEAIEDYKRAVDIQTRPNRSVPC
ncbi:unnamed protein product [Lymnaea stagnalis]|uniref:Tetratricopeptide repeat protein 6 n=1 Tax=Lymnaea stagnalis TaxID=6523 RepID=A0AAV2HBB5_LYMST